jgi:hypothetical protein
MTIAIPFELQRQAQQQSGEAGADLKHESVI